MKFSISLPTGFEGVMYPGQANQFSTFNPRTRLNSPSLAVTIVAAIA